MSRSAAIIAMLDAALASLGITRLSAAFLPEADHFELVDLTVRQWAAANGCSIHEWKQPTCQGFMVSRGFSRVVEVHRPELYWRDEPKAAPRIVTDADQMWSPAQ